MVKHKTTVSCYLDICWLMGGFVDVCLEYVDCQVSPTHFFWLSRACVVARRILDPQISLGKFVATKTLVTVLDQIKGGTLTSH